MSARLRSSTRASTAASESLAETIAEIKPKGGDTRKSSSTRSSESRKTKDQLMQIRQAAIIAFVGHFFVLGGIYHLLMNDTLKLYPNSIKVESLKGFNSRAEFALRYQTLLYAWLVFNIYTVIYVRLTKRAINPLVETTEKHAQKQKNILTNSFEQIVISSFLQLIFVSFAEHSYTLKLIPAINLVQFIGRIAFFIGYPWYRTFGLSLTLSPNLMMLVYNLYKLGAYVGAY